MLKVVTLEVNGKPETRTVRAANDRSAGNAAIVQAMRENPRTSDIRFVSVRNEKEDAA